MAGLLVLAGAGQLICVLYLLLKASRLAVNGAAIAARFWDVLMGLVTAPRYLSPARCAPLVARSCSCSPAAWHRRLMPPRRAAGSGAARVSARADRRHHSVSDPGIGCVVRGLECGILPSADVLAVRGGGGTHTWHSPQFASSGASSFMFSQQPQMTQKLCAPDLWMTGSAPLASWVHRTQSSVETPRCETPLYAPSPPTDVLRPRSAAPASSA